MSDSFKKFVTDEINAIMESMDECCKNDPILCEKVALEWIDKNAKKFRIDWDKKHGHEVEAV